MSEPKKRAPRKSAAPKSKPTEAEAVIEDSAEDVMEALVEEMAEPVRARGRLRPKGDVLFPESLLEELSREHEERATTELPELGPDDVMPDVGYGPRTGLLVEASDIVDGDRNLAYGEPEDSFAAIADMWSVYLGIPLLRQDVAALMVLMKVARVRTNPGHRDSWIDIAGYAACGGTMELPEMEEQE